MEPQMLSVDVALQLILDSIPAAGTETVALEHAHGRVLAETVHGEHPLPAWNAAAMDGFAVRAADLAAASREAPVVLPIVGDIPAGTVEPQAVGPGQAMRIMTGAPVPAGADAVVMVEDTREEQEHVSFRGRARPGLNVREVGEDLPAGALVLEAGVALRAAHLGLLATIGRPEVAVLRSPRVALLTTGTELVEVGQRPLWGQIHDANRYALAAQVEEAGAELVLHKRVDDDVAHVERALREAREQADVVIASGGVSVGRHDVVKPAIKRLGEVKLWQVAVKPGKPLMFGTIREVPVFGLPGNPVSSMVAFDLFVRPALARMGAAALQWHRLRAAAPERVRHKPGRREFCRGIITWGEDGQPLLQMAGGQGSARIGSMSEANCYVVIPETQGDVEPGTMAEVWLFPHT